MFNHIVNDEISLHETLDIFNDRMKKIGTASRQEAHLLGLWHQTFHCWVIKNIKGEEPCVLFQLRDSGKDTYPNLLDISCAGHLLTGESVEDGVRELKEELGIHVSFHELHSCGVYIEQKTISNILTDREFCHVFLYGCDRGVTEYEFQVSEVSGLYFIRLNQFQQLIQGDIDSIVAEGISLNVSSGESYAENREVSLRDFVPHSKAYYDLILREIHSLAQQHPENPLQKDNS